MKCAKEHDNEEAERHSGLLSSEKICQWRSRERITDREEQTVLSYTYMLGSKISGLTNLPR
jgi:hypothetical protein